MNYSKIAVTGSSGFVGQELVKRLKNMGLSVIEIDIQQKADTSQKPVDVLNFSELSQTLKDVDVIFHLAGAVQGSARKKPFVSWKLQTQGTLNILESAKQLEIHKVIMASSFYVYIGINPTITEVHEETTINLDQANVFGGSKYLAEQLMSHYSVYFAVNTVSLRFGSIYGIGASNLVGDLIQAGLTGGVVDIWGTGNRKNQYTYIGDIVNGCLLALDAEPGVYNLISPEQTTVQDLAGMCSSLFNVNIQFDPSKREVSSLPYMSSAKAIQKLGWMPINLQKGLEEISIKINNEGGSPC